MKLKTIPKIIKNKLFEYKISLNKNIHINLKEKKFINVSIAITCYNEVSYTLNALESLFKKTKDNNQFKFKFYLLDDCSTDKTYQMCNKINNLNYHREKKQNGVNNLWNIACDLCVNSDYVILINNDVKFSTDWANNIINEMIKFKSVAACPLTNAPGHRKIQNIRNYFENYVASDNDRDIDDIAQSIKKNKSFKNKTINGFCMAFNVKWLHTLDKPLFQSPDPNFYGEDIFFEKYPCNPLIVTSSFVFHYKQISVNKKNWKIQHFRK